MLNVFSRWIIFYSFVTAMNSQEKFDNLKKTFLYLDFGLDTSLDRFERNPLRNQSLNTNREAIIKNYNSQEYPTIDEAKNLEVRIITSVVDYKDELKRINKLLK